VQYLLEQGSAINAVDDSGRTALDWALTRGETPVAEYLRKAGGRSTAALEVTPRAAAVPRGARAAIERALMRLQPASRAFTTWTTCSSCHNESLPGIAATLARERGLAVDEDAVAHARAVQERVWRGRREVAILADATAAGIPPSALYGLLELAESRQPATAVTDAVVIGLASRQYPDGGWYNANEIRPPLDGSVFTGTAMAVRALQAFAPPGRRAEMMGRVVRAREFLIRTAPRDTQDHAFRLLGLVWAGASSREIARARAALVALQRPDGGWAQMPTLGSDAYATGQTLYALRAAGLAGTDPTYRRGAAYLLRTQLDDGTWFVRTRAFGVQPYFETGFPHGRSQFISAAATAWAAIALAYTVG
jgi:hypothetical protein